ncbi:MAG: cysteine--tRNA ligase [Patescibacteria group bacterium]
MVKLYNTLARKKEPFKPLKGKTVRLYTCGPTVYNYAHIGNLRAYVFADTLKRVLAHFKYRVHHVMNITDVGHLTSDADAGEDKMLLGAQRERKTVWQIAEFYTDAFKNDIADLNIVEPNVWCKATDHIYLQIELILKLEKKGFTYTADGNVYFDTAKLPDYGKLAGLERKREKSIARVEKDLNKKHAHDFVLWFTKSKFQDQDMKWESPWGVGYPGWHIECSAMSTHYLGQPFDINTGGIDQISVHNNNEIAKSEAAEGTPMVNIWMHNEHLIIDSKRMGKSEGNFITLDILKEKGYDPLAYRFFLLQTHYRQQLNFTWQSLDGAQNGYRALCDNVADFMRRAHGKGRRGSLFSPRLIRAMERIDAALADDLGTPQALALIFELVADVNRHADSLTAGDYRAVCKALADVDLVFGLGITRTREQSVPLDILALVKKREVARHDKRWSDADALRDEIIKAGYRVEDTADGSSIQR